MDAAVIFLEDPTIWPTDLADRANVPMINTLRDYASFVDPLHSLFSEQPIGDAKALAAEYHNDCFKAYDAAQPLDNMKPRDEFTNSTAKQMTNAYQFATGMLKGASESAMKGEADAIYKDRFEDINAPCVDFARATTVLVAEFYESFVDALLAPCADVLANAWKMSGGLLAGGSWKDRGGVGIDAPFKRQGRVQERTGTQK